MDILLKGYINNSGLTYIGLLSFIALSKDFNVKSPQNKRIALYFNSIIQ